MGVTSRAGIFYSASGVCGAGATERGEHKGHSSAHKLLLLLLFDNCSSSAAAVPAASALLALPMREFLGPMVFSSTMGSVRSFVCASSFHVARAWYNSSRETDVLSSAVVGEEGEGLWEALLQDVGSR